MAKRLKFGENVATVDGYVWCDVRGSIHDAAYGALTLTFKHKRMDLYDIYQDGTLCSDQDHRSVYVVTDGAEENSFGEYLTGFS